MCYRTLQPYLLLLLSLLFAQCQKEATPLPGLVPNHSKEGPLIVDGNSNALKSATLVETQLDDPLPNPYTVANMTAAWNALYPDRPFPKLPITDLYVRFEPKNLGELVQLEAAVAGFEFEGNPVGDNDPFLVDHPLDREVLVYGDYYVDPTVPSGEIPPYYGVVKPDFQVPTGMTYTILEELVLAPYASFLTMEAHRRVGLDYVGHAGQPLELCGPECPNYPACLQADVPCAGGTIHPLPVPCDPTLGYFPHCSNSGWSGLPDPPAPPTTQPNDCGCYINTDPLRPSGCIQVEDTQLGWEPVRQVEIQVQHWFRCSVVRSSHLGCWRVQEAYPNGFQGQVLWRNRWATMRLLRVGDPYHYGLVVAQNLGNFRGGNYNDIRIQHRRYGANSDVRKAHWIASTAMNALFEYNGYAHSSRENIGYTPTGMDVLLVNASTGGAAAPMLGKLQEGGFMHIDLSTIDLAGGLSLSTRLVAQGFLGIVASIALQRLVAHAPDVVLGYGPYDGTTTSDVIKATLYHEYAHTAHYQGLPSAARAPYWSSNIDWIVDNTQNGTNPPYGNYDGSVDAERCAIIELWGFHMGWYLADLQYGENCVASSFFSDQDRIEAARFIYRRAEEFDPNDGRSNSWIPQGLPFDLLDGIAHLSNPNIVDPVNDQIQGVTNQQIFRAITTNTPETMNEFKRTIKSYQRSPLVDSLFAEYNY